MEIERINDNTVKFYITYVDIEDRGFEREEIWYNRERSEQLFWQMMDEVNYKEDFNVDGPLWIQVQAMDKGLEIIVTKAQVSKNGESIELSTENGKSIDLSVDEDIENMLENKFGKPSGKNADEKEAEELEGDLSLVVGFHDFEDVIQLSHYFQDKTDSFQDSLYYYNNSYYFYLEFIDESLTDDEEEDIISKVFEFGKDTDITVHYLEEYGKKVFTDDTFEQVRNYFPAQL